MNNKNKTWFAMIIIGYIVVLMAYVINIVAENQYASTAEDKPAAAAENTPAVAENQNASAAENHAAIECGSCGAHVYEYWYWENINDGTPVKICRYCYENCIENTATE